MCDEKVRVEVAAGQQLEMRGTMQPGGVVLAARIENEEREDDVRTRTTTKSSAKSLQ